MTSRRGGLGRGLAALIPADDEGAPTGRALTVAEVAVDAIVPNPRQPRRAFDDAELEGLAASIRDVGVLQPIVVRPGRDGGHELVAGERRWRAGKLARLTHLPAIIRHTDDNDLLKEALVENIHRVDLDPLEEASAYQQLLDDFDVSQEELAARLGKSRPVVSNALRLLTLPAGIQRRVAAGVLSAGHARSLLALDTPAAQERLAARIVAEGMSVRATEEAVRVALTGDDADAGGAATSRPRRRGAVTAPALLELQHDLSDALASRVRLRMGHKRGRLQIEFATVDDLERLVGIIADGLATQTSNGGRSGAGPGKGGLPFWGPGIAGAFDAARQP